MLDLQKFCDQLVNARDGDAQAAMIDFFRLLGCAQVTVHDLAANHTALEIWEAMQRAAQS